MEWTDRTIAILSKLWMDGVATVEIGRRMKISKNAVIGKAHRLHLPPRPSPIKVLSAGPRKPRPSRAGKVTLANINESKRSQSTVRLIGPTLALAAGPTPDTPTVPLTGTTCKPRRSTPCCWPIGEPGTAGFRFCGDPTVPARSYCQDHCDIAYVKIRDTHAPGSVNAQR